MILHSIIEGVELLEKLCVLLPVFNIVDCKWKEATDFSFRTFLSSFLPLMSTLRKYTK